MTKEEFLNIDISKISQVYNGKRNCCRCGCRGNYISTTFHDNHRNEDINNNLVNKRLNRAKKLIMEGADVEIGSNYVDVESGNDRTLTFYFDDIKKS